MKRFFFWLVLIGASVVVMGVFWQAFSIVSYIRTGNEDWVDAHGGGSLPIHLGQLAVVIGAMVAAWGNWRAVGAAVGFLALSFVQLLMIGDTDEEGSWVNGFHGFLALVVMLSALLYVQWSAQQLGLRRRGDAAGGA